MTVEMSDINLLKRFLELAKYGTKHLTISVGDKPNIFIVTIVDDDIYARPG